MNWLLVILLGNGGIATERFPNHESCDSVRVWVTAKGDVRSAVCLEDLTNEPGLREESPSTSTGTGSGL